LGNFLDNAIEAVEQAEGQKTITLDIHEQGSLTIIEVKNPLTKEILNLEDIFRPGFSTKEDGHSGMGLHNCRQIAQKIYAELVCALENRNEIRFSLVLPKM
jgi:sensor histidine kinase regulating citrate/malate metabolism